MRRISLLCALAIVLAPSIGSTQQASSGPYSVIKSAKVGGPGGFDYVYANSASRILYINRRGMPPAITMYNLDTLAPAGRIEGVNGHGVAVDGPSNHGFTSSKPVVMFDTKTQKPLKNIEVGGNPDGIFYDSFNRRVYILSHAQPYATVIDGASGNIVGTIDLGGAPEQAVSDGKGHVYVDIEDMANIAVVDAKAMTVTAHYDLSGKGGTCAGLAIDNKNGILFAACRNPQNMVVLSANDGKIITTLPLGRGTDGAVFNPATMEAFSSQTDGTLTIVKENSPTNFVVEQTVQTMPSAKTLTLDAKTNRIFLIAAEFPPAPPRPAQGSQANPNPMIPDSFTILVVGKK